MEKFMKIQQEKKSESATLAPEPKPKPLPLLRKPLVMKMKMYKGKKAPPLVKPTATAAALEGRPAAQDKTEDTRQGEILQPSNSLE